MGIAMDNDGIHSGNSRRDTPTLRDLLKGILPLPEEMDRTVGRLRLSSAGVEAGDVFIALPGVTADGRDYISQAVERKAAAVLFEAQDAQCESGHQGNTAVIGISGLKTLIGEIASRYHCMPSRNLQITGVTGTNGKTTVAYLLAQALERLGGHCGYIGTLGTGFLDSLKDTELTTLDAISAHARLREFADQDATHAAIEVSSHGLDQGRANGIEFDVAIFTNLSQDHLDYHGSMDRYGRAKRKLFEFESLKCAVINADDPFGQELIDFCDSRGLRRITYGLHNADLVPTVVSLDTSGSKFSINFGACH